MKTHVSYRAESRRDYGAYLEQSENHSVCLDQLKFGCLARIADASEKMAENHAHLIAERDKYERWFHGEQRRRLSLERSIASLRGYITKLKKRV